MSAEDPLEGWDDDPEPPRGSPPHERWLERHRAADEAARAALERCREIVAARQQTNSRGRS